MATAYDQDYLGREILPRGDERAVATDYLGRDTVGSGPGAADYLGRVLTAGTPT